MVINISRFVGYLECTAYNDQSKFHFSPKLKNDSVMVGRSVHRKKSTLFLFLPVPLEMATLGDSIPITCVAWEHSDM